MYWQSTYRFEMRGQLSYPILVIQRNKRIINSAGSDDLLIKGTMTELNDSGMSGDSGGNSDSNSSGDGVGKSGNGNDGGVVITVKMMVER